MKIKEETIFRIIKIFKPEPRKWVARILAVAALPLISTPVWEPYARAILAAKFGINVPPATSSAGWILLFLALIIIAINHYIDSKISGEGHSSKYESDQKNVTILFNEIHTITIDNFIEYGRGSMILLPAGHYSSGVEGVINSSNFHIHDDKLRRKILIFSQWFTKSFSFYSYFTDTANPKLQKFNSRRSIHSDPHAKKAYEDFHNCINELEISFKSLCTYVNEKFPGFDFNQTNKAAFDDYTKYNTIPEKEISDFQFSVVEAIVKLEEMRDPPTLERLAREISTERVVVQVALDKLIKLQFAAHLYKGMPYQKYTLTGTGRKYYVDHRDEMSLFED